MTWVHVFAGAALGTIAVLAYWVYRCTEDIARVKANRFVQRREAYRKEALRAGRPPLECGCEACACELHAYRWVPGPSVCIWCRHGMHGEPDGEFP